MKDVHVIDRGCYERGCACYDDRVDTDGVKVFMESVMIDPKFNETGTPQEQVQAQVQEQVRDWAYGASRTLEGIESRFNGTRADDLQVGGTHYKDMSVQPWAVMEAVLTREEFIGFLKGNVIKYAMRQGKKDNTDDANKCHHYMKKLNEVMSWTTKNAKPN